MTAIPEPPEHVGTSLDVGTTEDFVRRDRETLSALPVFFRVLDSTLKTVMVAMLAVLVVSVGANVFGRFVLDQSLAFSDELARFLFIWVIFLGAALAHLHREHISVDLFVLRLPARLQSVVTVVQELLILGLMVALLLSARQVLGTAPGKFPLLGLPYNWMNVAVPVCAVIMGTVTVYRIASALRPAQGNARAKEI
jgi:TRAP-type C4-dicarboxylate transport system permease small subunit